MGALVTDMEGGPFVADDYDARLLESARVRKHRLDDSLLFGGNTQERSYSSATGRLLQSLLIAALVAAICVGYSFVHSLLEDQNRKQARLRGHHPLRNDEWDHPLSTALSRVTVISAHRHLDLRLPSDEPLASLIPQILTLLHDGPPDAPPQPSRGTAPALITSSVLTTSLGSTLDVSAYTAAVRDRRRGTAVPA